MSKVSVLSLLLIIQVILAGYLCCTSNDLAAFQANDKLLNISEVSSIEIDDREENVKTDMTLKDGKWFITNNENFPVAENKVKQLIKNLSGLMKGWPVGTTKIAAKEFKTDEANYNKRLVLRNGENKAIEIFMGTTPSFKSLNVRLGGDSNTYAVNLESVTGKTEDWQDKEVLRLNKDVVAEVQVNGLVLKKSDKDDIGFVLADLADKESMKKDGVISLLDKVTGVSYIKVLGTENKAEYKQDTPVLKYSVTTKDNKTIEYTVSGPNEDKQYIFKSSKLPFYFSVNMPPIDALKGMKRENLVEPQKSEPEATDGQLFSSPSQNAK